MVAEIVEAFHPQFEACEALLDYAKAHRPVQPTDDVGGLIHRTYVRSSKTYQAAYLLAASGYGVQAGMLNRSLFEDMVVAHWMKRHPDRTRDRYERHRLHSIEQTRAGMARHKVDDAMAHLPRLSDADRDAYADEFGYRHWTGQTLHAIAKDVEDEWQEGFDRDYLWWIFDIAHHFNNLLLHHTAIGLGLASDDDAAAGTVTYDVGPSKTHIHGALQVAFFSYGHTISLVLDGDVAQQLNELWTKHLAAAFMIVREVPV